MPGKRYLQGFKEPTWQKKRWRCTNHWSYCSSSWVNMPSAVNMIEASAAFHQTRPLPPGTGGERRRCSWACWRPRFLYRPRDGTICCLGEPEEGCCKTRRKFFYNPRNWTNRYPRNDGLWKMYGSGEPKMVSFWVSIMLHFRGGGGDEKQKVVELVFLRGEFRWWCNFYVTSSRPNSWRGPKASTKSGWWMISNHYFRYAQNHHGFRRSWFCFPHQDLWTYRNGKRKGGEELHWLLGGFGPLSKISERSSFVHPFFFLRCHEESD